MPSKEHEPLPEVAAALRGLLTIVVSVDVAPTADAAAASEKWDASAQETLARWTALQKNDLANLNVLLEKAKLKTLVISPMVGDAPTAH
jgi:hypothetical protein